MSMLLAGVFKGGGGTTIPLRSESAGLAEDKEIMENEPGAEESTMASSSG
jgi:hypothetical protein